MKNVHESKLDAEISRLLDELEMAEVGTEEYKTIMDEIVTLKRLNSDIQLDIEKLNCEREIAIAKINSDRENAKEKIESDEKRDRRFKVNGDVVIAGLVNLAGILIVLNYEQLSVVLSKNAFNMIGKRLI